MLNFKLLKRNIEIQLIYTKFQERYLKCYANKKAIHLKNSKNIYIIKRFIVLLQRLANVLRN